MKNRFSFAIVVLLAAMLACEILPGVQPSDREEYIFSKILSVAVNPPSGNGSFTLKVAYITSNHNYTGHNVLIPNIYCNYVTPDSATMWIGKIEAIVEFDKDVSTTGKLPFSVKQKDGHTVPGVYLAGCWTDDDPTLVTTTFTVVAEEKAPTEPPVAPPAATQPSQFLTTPLKGHFVYDYNTQDSWDVYAWIDGICLPESLGPEITITPDGKLSNTTCQGGENPDVMQTHSATYTYQINGTVDASGHVEFTIEVWLYGKSQAGEQLDVRHVIITGQGQFKTPTQAEGTASFTYTCDDDSSWAKAGQSPCDAPHDNWESSGEMPWKFEALP